MRKTHVFYLISLFSYKERKAFQSFLASPYFNRRPETSRLFDYFDDCIRLGIEEFDAQKAFAQTFQGLPYDDQKMRHSLHYLKRAVETFLALEEWQDTPILPDISLLRSYKKKEAIHFFEKQMNTTLENLERSPFRDIQYHFNKYAFYQEHYEYTNRTKRKGEMFLQEQTDALTIFYISGILRQSCIIQSHQNITASDYNQELVDLVIERVKNGLFREEPSVAIYFHSLQALQNLKDDHAFESLKSLIDLHWTKFRLAEIRDIYVLAINGSIRRINDGNRKFVREGFELYRSGIERKILLENKTITPFTYKNVLMMGMSLKEHQWVENFLYSYKEMLPEPLRENTFTYNLAIYYFRLPDYDKAMELLQKVDFKDTFNNLDARRMLLIIYYEIGAYDALDSHLDSFRRYLDRQKEVGYHRQLYLGLIKATKKVLRTQLNDASSREKLIGEIENMSAFAEKDWLIRQLSGQ